MKCFLRRQAVIMLFVFIVLQKNVLQKIDEFVAHIVCILYVYYILGRMTVKCYNITPNHYNQMLQYNYNKTP